MEVVRRFERPKSADKRPSILRRLVSPMAYHYAYPWEGLRESRSFRPAHSQSVDREPHQALGKQEPFAITLALAYREEPSRATWECRSRVADRLHSPPAFRGTEVPVTQDSAVVAMYSEEPSRASAAFSSEALAAMERAVAMAPQAILEIGPTGFAARTLLRDIRTERVLSWFKAVIELGDLLAGAAPRGG